MRILFDQGTPAQLARYFDIGEVTTAFRANLDTAADSSLLSLAEVHFEVLVTTDKNLKNQQNLAKHRIAIVVLGNQQWSIAQRYVHRIVRAVRAAKPGSYREIDMPKY